MIICGFPGIGKSSISRTLPGIVDLESTPFNKNWEIYVNVIEHMNKNYIVLCSSHMDLRKELNKRNINYIYVKPKKELKEEYIERYKKRGNDKKFIKQLYDNWDEYMKTLKNENVWELDSEEYLYDVLEKIRLSKYNFKETDSAAFSSQAPERLNKIIIMTDENAIEDLKESSLSIDYYCVD